MREKISGIIISLVVVFLKLTMLDVFSSSLIEYPTPFIPFMNYMQFLLMNLIMFENTSGFHTTDRLKSFLFVVLSLHDNMLSLFFPTIRYELDDY